LLLLKLGVLAADGGDTINFIIIIIIVITHANDCRGVGVFASVCLCVCMFFPHDI